MADKQTARTDGVTRADQKEVAKTARRRRRPHGRRRRGALAGLSPGLRRTVKTGRGKGERASGPGKTDKRGLRPRALLNAADVGRGESEWKRSSPVVDNEVALS